MEKLRRSQLANLNIHYQRTSLAAFLDAQQQLGLDSVAFWAGGSHYYLDHQTMGDWRLLKSALRSRGLAVTCLTTPSFTGNYQFAMAQDGNGFARSFAYFRHGIWLAAALEAPLMTVNSGWGELPDSGPDRPAAHQEAWLRSQDMLFRLAEEAKQLGVTLAMETLRAEETNLVVTLADLQRYLLEVNHPNLNVLLDTAAMASAGESVRDWLTAFGPRIVGLHFVDSTGEDHLAWGDGQLPLAEIMGTLLSHNFTGVLAFELTDPRYLDNPVAADVQNLQALGPWL